MVDVSLLAIPITFLQVWLTPLYLLLPLALFRYFILGK